MDIEADRGLSDLLVSPPVLLGDGFGFTEGPVWVDFDDALLFSDIPSNRILRWRPENGATEIYREPSGWSNGLTIDGNGNVLACEHGGRRVSLADYGTPGATIAVAEAWNGTPLNSPNDLVVHSSGAVFFTDPTYGTDVGRYDPPFGRRDQRHDLPFRGLYRIGPNESHPLLLDRDFNQPNGLAFTPDETGLYVGDSGERMIWRYEVRSDLTLGRRDLFVDQRGDAGPGAPDGMKVDADHRLWTTGVGGISVYESSGERLGRFETDEHAYNLAFGGPDFATLFITAGPHVYRMETGVTGLGPGSPAARAQEPGHS